jgi:HEAT repeat protein
VLLSELKKVKYEDKKVSFILQNLPSGIEHLSFKTLMGLLKDSEFNSRDSLIDAVSLIPEDIVIPELFKILKGGRKEYQHNVRITTLQILARFKLSYCVQPIIEQLPILPVSEAKEFSSLLSDFAGEIFSSRISDLLNQTDAKVRAAVISTLPDSGKKEFIKQIRNGFDDADPDVRIACIWALSDYEDNKLINQGFDMLRDPLERVRNSAAEVLGQFGSADKLNNFSALLKDENEVDDVKKSAVRGLCKSENSRAIDILVELVDENENLEEYTVNALAENPSKKTLTRIIENMKDGSPVLREKIINVFKKMGKSGEIALVKLLKEDIASLKESITAILEETGYVEHIIRKLSHRDPKIRRSAAEFLSMIGTKSAFRGIVLAARDPDQDVRVQVTRALEKLNSESGKEILEALKEDPDKRVRKFTMWALSRVKAKAIED